VQVLIDQFGCAFEAALRSFVQLDLNIHCTEARPGGSQTPRHAGGTGTRPAMDVFLETWH
jgi:hypothetical protein